MPELPINRIVRLIFLIAACAVVALLVGQILFPGNYKPIIAGWVMLTILVLMIPLLSWYLQAKTEATPRKDVISIFVSIASSLILIGSLGLAWLSLDSTQQQTQKNLKLSTAALENARAEQRSRRFMEALEKLGGDTPHKRLAGIYAFQKLDEDLGADAWKAEPDASKEDLTKLEERKKAELKEHWSIMDILTHFIQEISPLPEQSTKLKPPVIRVEVYEILKYLGARRLHYGKGEDRKLNFFHVDLRGYEMHDFRNTNPECRGVPSCEERCRPNFDGAQFVGANLAGANLECFSFKGASFADADMSGAILRNVDFTGADLTYTKPLGANMTDAVLDKDYQLQFASVDETTKCPTNFVFDPKLGVCAKPPPVTQASTTP